jgi:hypothetical protein
VGAVSGLWDAGHHRQAVGEAARAIDIRVKTMTAADLTGAALMTEAFNPAPPRKGERRLRFPEYQPDTKDWTSAHEGAMHFGRGCMQRIRNLVEHTVEMDEDEALESLAALSLLARWIDSAIVVTGEV